MTGQVEAGRKTPARLSHNSPAPARGHFGRRDPREAARKRYADYVKKRTARVPRVPEPDSVQQADRVIPAPRRPVGIAPPAMPAPRVVIIPPDTTEPVGPPAPTFPPIPFGGPWEALPYWQNESTCFVVASGPSIANVNFELIRGRKIIATNSSVELVPFADFLFFGDARWWDAHKKELVNFPGHVVTVSGVVKSKRLLRLKRIKPVDPATGFTTKRDSICSQRTSTGGSLNLAAHLLGAGKIGLIGADMGRAADGRSHGHTPHKWPSRPGNITWDEQMRVLKWIVAPLKARGIRVFNLSPDSRIPWWPKMTLEQFLAKESKL